MDLQPPSPPRSTQQISASHDQTSAAQPANTTNLPDIPGIDPSLLANLSKADLEALQPIIDALSLGSGEDGDEGDLDFDEDDPRVAELLRQMDVAGDVADDLEGKLDKLIATLGGDEVEMEKVLEEVKSVEGRIGEGQVAGAVEDTDKAAR